MSGGAGAWGGGVAGLGWCVRRQGQRTHSCGAHPVRCRGKPLREADPLRTGRTWRRPSATVDVKTAALRTLCQALVPDSSKARITRVGAGAGAGWSGVGCVLVLLCASACFCACCKLALEKPGLS